MKTKTMVMMAAASVFGAAGCPATEVETQKIETGPGKILIAYYSWSGNTRFAAEQIQKATGGTLFEIKPTEAYPSDYSDCVDQAKKEIRAGFKPALATKVDDFSKYDVIFVGTPNWWSTMAPPVLTFLSENNFSGKTIVPFVTHGGGGMARCESDMRKTASNAKFAQGRAFSGGSIRRSRDAIAQWVNETIDLKK